MFRLLLALCALFTQVACTVDPPPPKTAEASPTATASCVPPETVTKDGYALEGYCPRSTPLEVGQSRRLTVSAVHRNPCWSPPDFAGSFWRTHTHVEPKAMSALHGGVSGRMKLTASNIAVFEAPAVRTRERPDEPFERIPAEGAFVLRFHRIDGAIRRAACA